MSLSPRQLVVFLKAPRPGFVKTRLAQSLGAEEACRAYGLLVATLLKQLDSLQPVELRFTPDTAACEVEPWRRNAWTRAPQGTGGLGDRLHQAFCQHLQAGPARVVVIGSDAPAVTSKDIDEAWQGLLTHDLVLGPAEDGGYWLIGLNSDQPGLFQGIAWSTERVMEQTLERARQRGLKVLLLRTLTDVDTGDDWRRYQQSLLPPAT